MSQIRLPGGQVLLVIVQDKANALRSLVFYSPIWEQARPLSHTRHCHITVTSHFPASQGSEIFTMVISLLQITFYRPVVNSPVYASVVFPLSVVVQFSWISNCESVIKLGHDDLKMVWHESEIITLILDTSFLLIVCDGWCFCKELHDYHPHLSFVQHGCGLAWPQFHKSLNIRVQRHRHPEQISALFTPK